ncbi:MAG: acyl carrier protein [Myxococcota bacterium]
MDVDPAVLDRVRTCFAEALGLDVADVDYSSRVIADLGAESLDFLDIAFRLERAFDIRIPRGGVEAVSREELPDGETYEVNGRLTARALERLAVHMPEVPAEEFREGLKVSEIPMLFRVGTFYNVVIALRKEKAE